MIGDGRRTSRDVVYSDIVFSIVELEKLLETRRKIIGLGEMIFSGEDISRNRRCDDHEIRKCMSEKELKKKFKKKSEKNVIGKC